MKLLFLSLAVLAVHVSAAPQLISFKDGKLGVNFGGYHAGVGIGGLLGNGATGGLFAEAGTPHGQAARAGLGGAVDGSGGSAGGLYAGATAGGNVKAEAGLAGGVTASKSAGSGYASAQAGDHIASSGLGGESSVAGSTGFKFSGSKSFGGATGVIEESEVEKPIDVVKHKKVHKEFKLETANEIQPVINNVDFHTNAEAGVHLNQEPEVLNKEVHVQPSPVVYEKHIVKYKPHHHFRKTAYIGGYVGGNAPAPEVYKPIHGSAIQKRIDFESAANVGADSGAHGGVGEIGYTKQISYQRNPTFFADIFNIPIQTLKAVGGFLSNAAGSTSVSVQKTASVHAEPDIISSKHAPSSASSSDAHISLQTPSAGKIIDDIFAIPINTLGAVNKFLENNVPPRKKVSQDGGEVVRARGPHARRRANKEVIIVKEDEQPINAE